MVIFVLVVDDLKLFRCSVICLFFLELEYDILEVMNGKEVIVLLV